MQNTFLVLDEAPASLKDDSDFAALVPGFEKNGDQIQKVLDKLQNYLQQAALFLRQSIW